MRNVVNLFVIFGLIVLAAYSSLSDASQHGTMLWASTYKSVQKILTKCLAAITSLIRQWMKFVRQVHICETFCGLSNVTYGLLLFRNSEHLPKLYGKV